jgi:hypothetical protein
MLTPATARRLRDAGLTWSPAQGDRFLVADRDMDDEVFVISDMVIEPFLAPSGPLLRFNGTTEWALDQIEVRRALWLPREEQLRSALGDLFVALTRRPSGWSVSLVDGRAFTDADPEEALAAAILATRPG